MNSGLDLDDGSREVDYRQGRVAVWLGVSFAGSVALAVHGLRHIRESEVANKLRKGLRRTKETLREVGVAATYGFGDNNEVDSFVPEVPPFLLPDNGTVEPTGRPTLSEVQEIGLPK